MAYHALFGIASPRWEFSVDAWKHAQGLHTVRALHELTAEGLEAYLQNKILEDLELSSTTAMTNPALSSTELCLVHVQPRPKPDYTSRGLDILDTWDLREYTSALETLEENLVPALRWSWQCLAVTALAKVAQVYFWPSPSRTQDFARSSLTALTIYHVGFTIAYRLILYLVSRCQRHTEQLHHKVKELRRQRASGGTYCQGGGVEDLSEDDVRAWCGWKFRVISYAAWDRNMRASFYKEGLAMTLLELFGGWLTL